MAKIAKNSRQNKKISTQHGSGKQQKATSSLRPLLSKLILILLALVAVAVFIYYSGSWEKLTKGNIDPENLLQEALGNTFQSPTYHFQSKSILYINDEKRVFSVLQGEKSTTDHHVEGSILGTPINIYQIGDTTYQQDALGSSWYQIKKGEKSADASLLMAELNPQKDFYFSKINKIEDLGKEKLNGQKVRTLRFYPTLENKWIERYFQDITYTVQITNNRKPRIIHSLTEAVSKENNKARLTIENFFYDFDKSILIQAPVADHDDNNQ
ncbi:MAG: hypothetical protein RR396_04275 [Clostridiales bacterium]